MQRAHKTGSGNNFEYLTMKRVSYETNQFFLMLVMNWENSCVRLLVVPLCFIALHDKFEPKDVYRWLCFDACKATVSVICCHAHYKERGFLGSEGREAMKKVSGKNHSQEQLNIWANQNNPNNKTYRAKSNNHSNQLNPNGTHQQKHNTKRRYQKIEYVEWAPDYPEWDDWKHMKIHLLPMCSWVLVIQIQDMQQKLKKANR